LILLTIVFDYFHCKKYICLANNNLKYKKQGGRMGTQALAKATERMPSVFDDFFKPWNEWFDNGSLGQA